MEYLIIHQQMLRKQLHFRETCILKENYSTEKFSITSNYNKAIVYELGPMKIRKQYSKAVTSSEQ